MLFFSILGYNNFIRRQHVWTRETLKNLSRSCANSKPGRNTRGVITTRGRSSRLFFRKTRLVNNKIFILKNEFAQVVRIERDTGRSAFLALIRLLKSGFLCYISATASMRPGCFISINPSKINFQFFKKLKIYSTLLPISKIARGSFICNFENSFFSGLKLCRAAGVKAKIQAFSVKSGLVSLLMPSGKSCFIPLAAHGFIGSMSNQQAYLFKSHKAGHTRCLGKLPKVRGVAMNPVDHPHGGGEGKTSGGRPSVTPWGFLTKGAKTSSVRSRKKNKILKAQFLRQAF